MLRGRIHSVIAVILIISINECRADSDLPTLVPLPSFVDTRPLSRQAGVDLPNFTQLGRLHGSWAFNLGRGDMPIEYGGGADAFAIDHTLAVTMGYEGNGNVATRTQTALTRQGPMTLWEGVRSDRQEGYTAGGGEQVNFGYDRIDAQLAAAYRFSPSAKLSVYGIRDAYNNARLPATTLDATDLRRGYGSAILEMTDLDGVLSALEVSTTYQLTTATSDNFSLRAPSTIGFTQYGRWATLRNEVRAHVDGDDVSHDLTLDFSRITGNIIIDASLATNGRAAYRQPASEILASGLAWKSTFRPSDAQTLILGARLDVISSQTDESDSLPAVTGAGAAGFNRTPRQLWIKYYGPDLDLSPTDVNVSARARYEWRLTPTSSIFVNAQRMVRSPDGGERYYAIGAPSSSIQTGNPNLAPEAHHRLDIGATPWARPDGNLTLSVWGDRVHDFIALDHARGQAGIYASDSAIVTRNIEAYLTGVDVAGSAKIWDGLNGRIKTTFTRGVNMTDGIALYQVPPLMGEAVLTQSLLATDVIGWTVSAATRFAGTQSFVDSSSLTGSALDNGGKTGGWMVFDLMTAIKLDDRILINGGVTNLLDKRYRNHINPLPQGASAFPMEAPGQSAFISSTIVF